jgi:hypothetical protein
MTLMISTITSSVWKVWTYIITSITAHPIGFYAIAVTMSVLTYITVIILYMVHVYAGHRSNQRNQLTNLIRWSWISRIKSNFNTFASIEVLNWSFYGLSHVCVSRCFPKDGRSIMDFPMYVFQGTFLRVVDQ